LVNVPNIAADFDDPRGVPIDGIIFGGRTRDREPLVRAIEDLAEGVYDGLTLGAEATFAAEGLEGMLRYDPMSMRPFMSYAEGEYAEHWLRIVGEATHQPIFAHVNWFQRDPEDGHFLWPGYRENLRALLWLMQLKNGEVAGRRTPVGIVPTKEELDLEGLDIDAGDLDTLLTIDTARWRQEMEHREQHLAQFDGLPEGDLGGPPPGRPGPGRRGGLAASGCRGAEPLVTSLARVDLARVHLARVHLARVHLARVHLARVPATWGEVSLPAG
jgi:phosphoenolpyruvate carboxykinase (GTP)